MIDAEALQAIFSRIDDVRPTEGRLVEVVNSNTREKVTGYFDRTGAWKPVMNHGSDRYDFKPVTVFSSESLIAYANHHASKAITEKRAVLTVNQSGLFLAIDYGVNETAERRLHTVHFPATWDEECAKSAQAIGGVLNKWVSLETFDELIEQCASFITNFSALESAAATITGTETAKIGKTKTGYQVEVKGDVACMVELPKTVDVGLLFMGQPVTTQIPFRVRPQDRAVQFYLVDNGALTKAKMAVLKNAKETVVKALPELLVIDGRI